MKNRALFAFVGGVSVATAAYLWWRKFGSAPVQRLPRKEDLYYSHLSPEELESKNLVDLNDASEDELKNLGLDTESLQRVVENRPYRSRLELVSRMVLSEAAYATIKDRVGVALGDEPVKTAAS